MALRDEILEQPRVVERLLGEAGGEVERVCAAFRAADPAFVLIAARGTSDNAAIYAQYALGVLAGIPVALATPSVISLYGAEPRMERALVVGISQSGASPDIVGVIEAARRQGATTVAITNTPGSPLHEAAEHLIDVRTGPERAVAATKTYTATLAALAMLSSGLSGSSDASASAGLAALPAALGEALSLEDEVRRICADQARLDRCVVLGRGYHYATAREWSIKLKELAYVLADPYSSADFMHGPLALVEPGFPVLAVAPAGDALDDVLAVLDRVRDDLSARLLVISDAPEALERGEWHLRLPATLPEWLVPLVAIVPGQLHAMHLATARGHDPESPRSIGKVTLTR
jgi:glutamine---fructose-6-phosphate transaminase (isomerizing)